MVFKMSVHRLMSISRKLTQCNRSIMIMNTNYYQINTIRCVSVDQPKKATALKTKKEKLRMYFIQRYINYVKNYTSVLEVRFPTAMKMYRVFSVGIIDFLRDLKTYISLRIKVTRDQGFSNMSRQDIELYQRMPSEMWRVTPVLILSAIPFGNYIIFPLAFLKPRTLLCSHFWSIQQRAEFSILDLKERLKHNRPVLRALQAKVAAIPDGELKDQWKTIIARLGSGVHPTPSQIVACQELFLTGPYHLNNLTYVHAGHLLNMHGLKRNLFRRNKLKYRAFIIFEMDKAILREGGLDALSTEALRNMCHIRGLNSSHLTNQDMKEWLEKWLYISQIIDDDCYSLILHCPIFLAYNHPQNWMLIY